MKKLEREELLQTLARRFENNMARHEGISWEEVRARLEREATALTSLQQMEATGGEPDVIGRDGATGQVTFCDCSAESPSGRRSLCYDGAALASRKEHKPRGKRRGDGGVDGDRPADGGRVPRASATRHVRHEDVELDRDSADVRGLGGALFCDRRYGRVFVYHNGAESYYAASGFRASRRV